MAVTVISWQFRIIEGPLLAYQISKTWQRSRNLSSWRSAQRFSRISSERFSIETCAWVCSSTISYCLRSSSASRSTKKTNLSKKASTGCNSCQFPREETSLIDQKWTSQKWTIPAESLTIRAMPSSRKPLSNRVRRSLLRRRVLPCRERVLEGLARSRAEKIIPTQWQPWMRKESFSRRKSCD